MILCPVLVRSEAAASHLQTSGPQWNTETHSEPTERGPTEGLLWVPTGRFPAEKGESRVLTGNRRATQLWTTQNRQQRHYLTTLRAKWDQTRTEPKAQTPQLLHQKPFCSVKEETENPNGSGAHPAGTRRGVRDPRVQLMKNRWFRFFCSSRCMVGDSSASRQPGAEQNNKNKQKQQTQH